MQVVNRLVEVSSRLIESIEPFRGRLTKSALEVLLLEG